MTIRSTPRGLAILGLLLAMLPAAARAADSADAAPQRMRVHLAFYFGPQHYSLSDVNDAIQEANKDFRSNPSLSQSGIQLPSLHGGIGVGAGIRVWPREEVVIAGDYTHLSGTTSASAPLNAQPGAPTVKTRVSTPAHSLGLTVGYFFYRPWSSLRVGAGLGGAYYIADGETELTYPGFHDKSEMHGTGFGAHALILGDLKISNIVQFEAAVGYRHAKTRDLEDRGATLYNTDGSKAQADYSGIVTRVGIDIPFGPPR